MAPIALRHRWALELLEIQPGERILEVGCGHGIATELALAAGADVVAVDRSVKMVEACRKRNAGATGLVVKHGVFEVLELGTQAYGRFNRAFAVNVDFPRHPNLGWAAKFRDAIKPGGTLVLALDAKLLRTAERFALAASETLAGAMFHVDTEIGQNMVAVRAQRIG